MPIKFPTTAGSPPISLIRARVLHGMTVTSPARTIVDALQAGTRPEQVEARHPPGGPARNDHTQASSDHGIATFSPLPALRRAAASPPPAMRSAGAPRRPRVRRPRPSPSPTDRGGSSAARPYQGRFAVGPPARAQPAPHGGRSRRPPPPPAPRRCPAPRTGSCGRRADPRAGARLARRSRRRRARPPRAQHLGEAMWSIAVAGHTPVELATMPRFAVRAVKGHPGTGVLRPRAHRLSRTPRLPRRRHSDRPRS